MEGYFHALNGYCRSLIRESRRGGRRPQFLILLLLSFIVVPQPLPYPTLLLNQALEMLVRRGGVPRLRFLQIDGQVLRKLFGEVFDLMS